ncbi:MAG: helix-turn-helix domain-containing protein [Clostridiales bacterium]|nr:helix-turn-helix domain-containing protein [Clostridiales bacterium]
MDNFEYALENYCSAEYMEDSKRNVHPTPHTHEKYEMYFLHSGNRDVFIDNEMFSLTENCLAIIPPLCYHKVEGGAFQRTNLSFHKIILSKSQSAYVDTLVEDKALIIGEKYLSLIRTLLNEACEVKASSVSIELKNERIAQITRTVLLFLSMQSNKPIPPASTGKKPQRDRKNTSSEMLRIAQYINNNYMHKITLDDICKKFLISKTALNVKFRDVMQTTVVDYLLGVRLNRAVYLLNHTRRSVEEISQACGFSSANYFGLIFKKKMGRPPSSFHRRKPGKRKKTTKTAN